MKRWKVKKFGADPSLKDKLIRSGSYRMYMEEQKETRLKNIKAMVVTISDSRTFETDKSGRIVCELLSKNFYTITRYEIIKDQQEHIKSTLISGIQDLNVDVILINGGTDLPNRDSAINVVDELVDTAIPGFGELFRMLSYKETGPASMLSRAVAGMAKRTVIFSTPSSTGAVKLAMEKLILPNLVHIVKELTKDS